ncbi:MAG: hypothetical protein QGI46_00810 [Planctomycetota bacterium]|nr:hypothetical protein [Planctomycetota bacterium]
MTRAPSLLVVIVAHLGQPFVGALVAARIAASRPMLLAMIMGSLALVASGINPTQLPGQVWMRIEVPLYLVVARCAAGTETRRWEAEEAGHCAVPPTVATPAAAVLAAADRAGARD